MSEFIAKLLLYIAPMYFANASAMIFGGGRTRMDFGANFLDGKPLLGSGKTLRGMVTGITAGTLVSVGVAVLIPGTSSLLTNQYVLLGFLLSLGAIAGDTVKSFFKRRAGIEQGKDLFLIDQLDFIVGGIIFGLVLYTPTTVELFVIAIGTVIVHRLANFMAFKFKLKKVPW